MGALLSTLAAGAGAVARLAAPPRCLGCDRCGTVGLCAGCLGAIQRLRLADAAPRALAPGAVALSAFAYHGPLAAAVRAVKVGGRTEGVEALRDLLAPLVPAAAHVTWVPSPRRRRAGGPELARLLAPPGAVRLLRVRRARPDQTRLGAAERRRNPDGAFAVSGPAPASAVVVDDVRATGATARAAATALQQAGARRVVVVTLAASLPGGRAGPGAAPPGRAARR